MMNILGWVMCGLWEATCCGDDQPCAGCNDDPWEAHPPSTSPNTPTTRRRSNPVPRPDLFVNGPGINDYCFDWCCRPVGSRPRLPMTPFPLPPSPGTVRPLTPLSPGYGPGPGPGPGLRYDQGIGSGPSGYPTAASPRSGRWTESLPLGASRSVMNANGNGNPQSPTTSPPRGRVSTNPNNPSQYNEFGQSQSQYQPQYQPQSQAQAQYLAQYQTQYQTPRGSRTLRAPLALAFPSSTALTAPQVTSWLATANVPPPDAAAGDFAYFG